MLFENSGVTEESCGHGFAGMILHVAPDEKFVDMGLASFERVAPGRNELILFKGKGRATHVKKEPVEVLTDYWLRSKRSALPLDAYELIILHSLSPNSAAFINANRNRIRAPVVWLAWGFDYYPELALKGLIELEGERTRSAASEHGFWMDRSILTSTRRLVSKVAGISWWRQRLMSRLRAKAAICAPVLLNECGLIRKGFPEFRGDFVDWNYGTLEDDLVGSSERLVADDGDVWLGNSATLSNNHMDGFSYLASVLGTGRRIHVPLSYGRKEYGAYIMREGVRTFGDQFNGLTSFVPADEYRAILARASYFLMPHIRQQALGNIIMALHMGGRVFLDPRSPTWSFFKDRNVVVFPLEDFPAHLGRGRLSDGEIERNRAVLKRIWGRDSIDMKTKQLLERAEQLRETSDTSRDCSAV